MIFETPLWQGTFLLLAAAIIAGVWDNRRKTKKMRLWAASVHWRKLISGWSPYIASRELTLWGVGVAMVILALMRPQYGVIVEKINRNGQDILLVLDVSKSMMAQDISPSRIDYAKRELGLLLERLQGDRVGLILFAGAPYTQSPLTYDYASVSLYVQGAYAGMLPEPGTRLGEALGQAAGVLRAQNNKFKAVVVITDGETFDDSALNNAKALAQLGARLYIIGLGSTAGDPIPDLDAEGTQIGFKKDESGEIVLSKRQDVLLSQLAAETKGIYLPIDKNKSVVDQIYQDISKEDKQRLEGRLERRQVDRYQWPLFVALVCFTLCWFWPRKKS